MTETAPQETSTDVQVRIGELAATGAGRRLVTVGLGSCVGVAIIDRTTGAAGLAHVFLPEVPAAGLKPGAHAGTYAPLAVPALIDELASLGARRRHGFVAVLAGGARMFAASGSGADVGERNLIAVRRTLAEAGITVVAEEVGGSHGRTMRVRAGEIAHVTVRAVGSDERAIWTNNVVSRPLRHIAA